MRLKVYLLRYRGRRLAWREVVNGPKYVGDVRSLTVALGEEQLRGVVLRPDDPELPSPVATLYEPVLLGLFPLALRLRGFERYERGTAIYDVIQEWHCELP